MFLLGGDIETKLIFHENLELAYFAAFTLINTHEGRDTLRRYYRRHAANAVANKVGFILETPTWRASSDWGDQLGYNAGSLAKVNADTVNLMLELRDELRASGFPIVISGCIGPRSDGYVVGEAMTAAEAQAYHKPQVKALTEAGAEMVTALTMTYPDEAIGITRTARQAGKPVVIFFTVETDGRLPSGHSIGEAITAVDAATEAGPAYYMINCAHTTHFQGA
jgi:S-methylmethionine-dependent homocysteine/selenocysteine methylase